MKHQNDPGLNDPIQGATEVRQAYDALPSAAVPAELDARILARAREAVSKPSNIVELKQPAVRRWAMPITVAASVVVVMSVVYESRFSETQFSTPPSSPAAVTSSVEQNAKTFIEEDREPAPASAAPEVVEQKPIAPRSKPMADAADVAPAPPPPAASPQALAMMEEAMAPAPVAPVISPPMPKESTTLANELRQESKGQDSKEQERARANAVAAQSQLLGKVAKQADSKSSLAALEQLAGYYSYQSYSVTLPSGQVLGLKELGATTASLNIDAQGTLTLLMNMSNDKTIVQTAKVLEVKLGDSNGYWIAQWPDMSYAVKSNIVIDGDKLVSTTRFEERTDSARYGSVEQATLRRVAGRE